MNASVIIRHARTGLDLIINGAVRQIESQHADTKSEQCTGEIKDLFVNLRQEMDDWAIDV